MARQNDQCVRFWAHASDALGVGDPEGCKPLRCPDSSLTDGHNPEMRGIPSRLIARGIRRLVGLGPKFGALHTPLIRAGSDALKLYVMRKTLLRSVAAHVARLLLYAIIRELVRAAILSLIDDPGPW